jgi:hypothetical protein
MIPSTAMEMHGGSEFHFHIYTYAYCHDSCHACTCVHIYASFYAYF